MYFIIFEELGHFSPNIFPDFWFPFLGVIPIICIMWIPIICMLAYLMVSYMSVTFCSILSILASLHSSEWIASVSSSSKRPIHYSASSNLLVIPPMPFSFPAVLFNTRIYIWFLFVISVSLLAFSIWLGTSFLSFLVLCPKFHFVLWEYIREWLKVLVMPHRMNHISFFNFHTS